MKTEPQFIHTTELSLTDVTLLTDVTFEAQIEQVRKSGLPIIISCAGGTAPTGPYGPGLRLVTPSGEPYTPRRFTALDQPYSQPRRARRGKQMNTTAGDQIQPPAPSSTERQHS